MVDTVRARPEQRRDRSPRRRVQAANSHLVERYRLVNNRSLLSVRFTWTGSGGVPCPAYVRVPLCETASRLRGAAAAQLRSFRRDAYRFSDGAPMSARIAAARQRRRSRWSVSSCCGALRERDRRPRSRSGRVRRSRRDALSALTYQPLNVTESSGRLDVSTPASKAASKQARSSSTACCTR